MSESILVKSGGGADLDVVTAIAADIVAPKVSVDKDGEPIIGTIIDRGNWNSSDLVAGASVTIPAGKHGGSGKVTAKSLASQTACTATDGYVYSGKTYWKDGALRTGGMAINSILSFSAAAYGGKQILLKWQNPYAATGKPFSGVEIRYGTGGYPGTGGSVIYTGAGNNTAPGGWSQVVVTLPSFGTTYYFSLRSYATCSAGIMYGGVINSSAATQSELWLTFTSSQNYTIPTGYSKLDIFAVGGGGSSSTRTTKSAGLGAGGGYTKQQNNISVTVGEVLSIIVGTGGALGQIASNGSPSIVSRSGSVLVEAAGGTCSDNGERIGRGGSGGGNTNGGMIHGGRGGSNGSSGYTGGAGSDTQGGQLDSSYGQGTTTRAWGSGTLYSGGGGAGTSAQNSSSRPTWGGAGGNGGGGSGTGNYHTPGANGAPNTGGGAGGSGYCKSTGTLSSSGGSGIVLVHLY